jgi:hypothetical protein
MYARAVDDAATRLSELRHEEWEGLALGAFALALSLAATQLRPTLAVPLFLGGLLVGARGLAAGVRRSELVEWLVGDRDAYVIAEVRAYAAREATMPRRAASAAWIRAVLAMHDTDVASDLAEPLRALAVDLDDTALDLDPAAAVACARLVEDEALLVRDLVHAPAAVRSRVERIRAGFSPAARRG